MMTSSNGTFSALLALCAGNSSVTGEFSSQRPVTRSFGVFFDLDLNKRLSKQSKRWGFETPSCSLWRHRNVRQKCWELLHGPCSNLVTDIHLGSLSCRFKHSTAINCHFKVITHCVRGHMTTVSYHIESMGETHIFIHGLKHKLTKVEIIRG